MVHNPSANRIEQFSLQGIGKIPNGKQILLQVFNDESGQYQDVDWMKMCANETKHEEDYELVEYCSVVINHPIEARSIAVINVTMLIQTVEEENHEEKVLVWERNITDFTNQTISNGG